MSTPASAAWVGSCSASCRFATAETICVVRGTIVQYDVDVPVAFSANPVQATSARRRLQLRVDVEIYDQVRARVLWSKKGMVAEGDYAENEETSGRRQAKR